MTDLSQILPGFPTQQHARLLPSIEQAGLTTADLLTLDCVEIAKRARVPLLDVKRLCEAVLGALRGDLGVREELEPAVPLGLGLGLGLGPGLRTTGTRVVRRWETISTLDEKLDGALGGGVPLGYVTEVTGERYDMLACLACS